MMCFQGKSVIPEEEGSLTGEHKYMSKLANTAFFWRRMTHWLQSLMKISSLEATQFSFLWFHIYQATFEFKFSFSVFSLSA